MRAGRCWIRGGWTVTISMASRAPPFQWGAIPLPAVRRAMHYDAQTKSTASLVRRPSKFAGLSRFMLGGWSGWVWPAGQAGSGQLVRLGLASGQPPAASLALTRATSESSGLVHDQGQRDDPHRLLRVVRAVGQGHHRRRPDLPDPEAAAAGRVREVG